MTDSDEPAFPVPFGPKGERGWSEGMSLHDYYAAEAMKAMLGRLETNEDNRFYPSKSDLAKEAHDMADAMLFQREDGE